MNRMPEFPPSDDYSESAHLNEPASTNQVLVNTECLIKAVQLTMHTNGSIPKYRATKTDASGKRKGLYTFTYRKLGKTYRLANQAVAQRYKELRRSGVPHSDIPLKDVPMAYCLANPLQVMLGKLCARDIQTVADQKSDF